MLTSVVPSCVGASCPVAGNEDNETSDSMNTSHKSEVLEPEPSPPRLHDRIQEVVPEPNGETSMLHMEEAEADTQDDLLSSHALSVLIPIGTYRRHDRYGKLTTRIVLVAFVVNVVSLSATLLMQASAEWIMTPKLLFLRGLLWGTTLPYLISNAYLFKLCLLCEEPTFREVLALSVVFMALATLLSSIPAELGIGIFVLGASCTHQVCTITYFFLRGAPLEAVFCAISADILVWSMIAATLVTVSIYAIVAEYSEILGGCFVACAIASAECLLVFLEGKRTEFFEKTPGAKFTTTIAVCLIHTLAESNRLAAMIYGAIVSSHQLSWVYALSLGLILNVFNRLNWLSWICGKICFRRLSPMAPGIPKAIHNESKFLCGYLRFAAPLSLLIARAVLIGHTRPFQEWWFNNTVVVVVIYSLLIEALEDFLVSIGVRFRCDAPWVSAAKGHYTSLPESSSKRLYLYSDGVGRKVPLHTAHWSIPVFSVTCASVLTTFGLAAMTSWPYLLHLCEQPRFAMPRAGILLWPVDDLCT
eukprot:TRINITY_DN27087_c0_g1_i1.p1 TRINITY_DN27087_c0_g1~~TRINITY_DN27087_c0_g1_i1.p1  ORF type:complete len:531 (-),score=25.96 TRINITY_DN27087_c0_g1_i1:509-2101(-)